MDLLSLLRTLGGLGVVLGLLAGALWLVRRYDLRLPGRAFGAQDRRLEVIETLPIDARRSVALVRRDGHEHLVLIAPEGHVVLESAVVSDAVDLAAQQTRRDARETAAQARSEQRRASAKPAATTSFAALVDTVQARSTPAARALHAALDRAYPALAAAIDDAPPEPARPARKRKPPVPVAAPAPIVEPARKRPPVAASPATPAKPTRNQAPSAPSAAPAPVGRPARKRPAAAVPAAPVARPVAKPRTRALKVAAPAPAPIASPRKRAPRIVAAPTPVVLPARTRRSAKATSHA